MDPRPYHFEYRKPRLSNPTFQSSHFYQSMFRTKDFSISKAPSQLRNPELLNKSYAEQPQSQIKRSISTELNGNKLVELQNIGSYRYGNKSKIQSARAPQSKMASYGSNLVRNTSMDQAQVYKKQEKEFNIISFYPKEYKPNLRQFPKLTLENKLIEFGNNPNYN